ncbi:MAG: VanZ family protein [Peptostreptococcaceae bacterium]
METLIINILISLVLTMIYINGKYINKKEICIYGTVIIFFVIVMVIIFYLTGISPISGFHLDIRINEIEYIPFVGITKMLKGGLGTHAIINIIGNIIMFLPVGFLVPLISSDLGSLKKTILIGFKISLLIEFTQLFLIRATDVDDLILNTTGTILGYLIFIIFKRIFPTFKENILLQGRAIQGKQMILNCILIPYIVIIVVGFYERLML